MDFITSKLKNIDLTTEQIAQLNAQNSRLVPEHQANNLEKNAQRHWDLFYKRNSTKFFKDRRWTTREFHELLCDDLDNSNTSNINANEPPQPIDRKKMLEVGCGVGNMIYPLIEEKRNNYFIYACDFSPRAIEFVISNPLYNENNIKAFQCDITTETIFNVVAKNSLNIITMIFVLSAIHPDKYKIVMKNMFQLLQPGGVLLFRDYGRYDMAQIRFKPGHKIAENFYMRQDGTRSYYFAEDELLELAAAIGFDGTNVSYVHRRTINVKENIDTPRTFVQCKFMKPFTTVTE